MARTPLRLVRATAAQIAAYTGPAGEPVFNTDTSGIHLQDGVTPGGTPLMRAGPHTPVVDVDYTIKIWDVQVGFMALSASRTAILPDVDSYPIGQVLFIADESGQCSADRPITIAAGAGTGDTIAGQTAILLTDAYQGLGFRRGASNVWIIAR
jgi:hypothetical protein